MSRVYNFSAGPAVLPEEVPVSYTHLDVYKRQALQQSLYPSSSESEGNAGNASLCTSQSVFL